jgi:mannose-6-phosphate isomerase-like protein (cupin superfamily)
MKIIEKPWGREVWIAHNDKYAFKLIEFKAGSRSSLQYHERKHETIYIDQGKLEVEVEADDENGQLVKTIMGAGDVIENAPMRRHRITAIEDVRLFEVSTPELEDVVRVEDDYGRK